MLTHRAASLLEGCFEEDVSGSNRTNAVAAPHRSSGYKPSIAKKYEIIMTKE